MISRRIAESVLTRSDLEDFHSWYEARHRIGSMHVEPIPLEELKGWDTDPVTGNIGHESGGFYTIEGLDIHVPDRPISHWDQPIIHQPEIGVLGILVKEFDGVLHCLMQAKAEPGNHNGTQLSPTVQATRSNYTRLHGGREVPYLDYFRRTEGHLVIADVRQSEQGAWFYHKRNRNMVVEVREDVEVLDGFHWLTLGELHQLLGRDDLVNMDTRTVLSCLPFAGTGLLPSFSPPADSFQDALIRSYDGDAHSRHGTNTILSWITELRSLTRITARRVPINRLTQWRRTDGRISHERGLFFEVVGVNVTAAGREVDRWMQPMISAVEPGLAALIVTRIDGVLHALMQARVEPGYVDVIELAPTVQCTPRNHERLPPFVAEVLSTHPDQIRLDVTLSEEGGRFYQTRTRYLVVEVPSAEGLEGPAFRWMTLAQLVDLLRHSNYLNIQSRSLVACLHSLSGSVERLSHV
ncbi:NDP-hexose 2,3-dehydratase family protein [Nonomuraea sp. B19D2]|uniref:NDP-hexose 2,3-dehydratase family protein n=1 Tax=Nonomuraea sp. B19D2 TaxID=3159561 RepID=UPI0032DB1C6F